MHRIILPQAFRVMLPPGMTRVIALMKDTSLVTVIAGGELMTNAQIIYTQNFMVIELLSVVCVWYMALVSILMLAQRGVERWASRYQGETATSIKPPMLQWG
jgi:polar amino acid transport system permease protein